MGTDRRGGVCRAGFFLYQCSSALSVVKNTSVLLSFGWLWWAAEAAESSFEKVVSG